MQTRGFSLMETVVYIGLLAIVLSVFALTLLRLTEQYHAIDPGIRMEQRAAILFYQLQYEITQADSVDVTNSVLSSHPGKLVFQNREGESVTIEVVSDTVDFEGTEQTVQRLRYQVGMSESVWITDPDMQVSEWIIEAVRNSSSSSLTGLNFFLTIEMLDAFGAYRSTTLQQETSISLQPQTSEI